MRLIVLAALLSTAAHAAPFEPPAADCAARLKPYAERIAAPVYALDLADGAGRLVYLGAEHSSDPAHAQFAEIERRWSATKPELAFYEGPNRPLPATREEVIRQTGESGFVRFLAARDGVPLARLEPDPKEEGAYVMQQYTPEQTVLFYTLREAARLRERRGQGEAEIAAAIDQLLARTAQLFASPLRTSADVAQAYRKYWSRPEQWWQAPSAWFAPGGDGAKTGGGFLNAVNARSSAFRDVNMYNKLSAAVHAGKRVFAVVGRDHVSHQAEALTCALGQESHHHD